MISGYDHLGLTLSASLIGWLLFLADLRFLKGIPFFPLPLLSFAWGPIPGFLLVIPLFSITTTLWATSYGWLAQAILKREDPRLLHLLEGLWLRGKEGFLLGVCNGALLFLLLTDLYALFQIRHPFISLGIILLLYLLLFWCGTWLYQIPLLIRGYKGPIFLLRQSGLLVLDNLIPSLLMALWLLFFTLFCLLTWVPLLLLWPIGFSLFQQSWMEELLTHKYSKNLPVAS